MKFVRAWVFADNMRASRLQAKGRRRHLSQNIGPAVAGSARPVPPPLEQSRELFSGIRGEVGLVMLAFTRE